MYYSIKYTSKKGNHVTQYTSSVTMLKDRITSLHKDHIEAVAFIEGGEMVARVWSDNTQIEKWNYFIKL